ncbi:MAG TPA: IS110 family transposase [Candidatus Dormibacteraeota bacterium]|nr:IS110 family transposase [Candidatus Dormibacteraeota bacterium]
MDLVTVGLDIAKSMFQLHGTDRLGKPVLRRKLPRSKMLEFFANLPSCRIGLEACGGAHYWARELTKLGHEVRLMPPQYVKPYVKTNKHDAADAEGCCEAVQRPNMRFVPVKSEQQQALLMLHRIRDRLNAERTGTINAIRGHMAEFGIVAAQRGVGMKELLAIISDVDDGRLPSLARDLLVLQVEHLRAIEAKLAELDRQVLHQARSDEAARRLTGIPGIGPVIATAMVATVDAKLFDNGRGFAAWLGLAPRQHASGGKERLLGISKRGDGYLRRQLMHGARSLVRVAAGRERQPWAWINGLLARRHFNVVVAAVANKLARIIWVLLNRDEAYRVPA